LRTEGVQVGIQTYSYRSFRGYPEAPPLSPSGQERLVDRMIEAMEPESDQLLRVLDRLIEPVFVPYNYGNSGAIVTDSTLLKAREELRRWRTSRPNIFRYVRKKFADANIQIYSCMFNFSDSCTDEEIESAFDMAHALGTSNLTANPTVASWPAPGPFRKQAQKCGSAYIITIFTMTPNEIATVAALTLC